MSFIKWFLNQVDNDYDQISDFLEYSVGHSEEFDSYTLTNGYTLTMLHSIGGNEGGGEHVERVFSVYDKQDKSLKYYKVEGSYASYDGTDMNYRGIKEVFPVEKVVTVYE